jgi:hypothetical protein
VRKIEICCERLNEFLTEINRLSLTIGEGEISGSVSIYQNSHDKIYTLSIDDGWNFIPTLDFHYCPYCGKEL